MISVSFYHNQIQFMGIIMLHSDTRTCFGKISALTPSDSQCWWEGERLHRTRSFIIVTVTNEKETKPGPGEGPLRQNSLCVELYSLSRIQIISTCIQYNNRDGNRKFIFLNWDIVNVNRNLFRWIYQITLIQSQYLFPIGYFQIEY